MEQRDMEQMQMEHKLRKVMALGSNELSSKMFDKLEVDKSRSVPISSES